MFKGRCSRLWRKLYFLFKPKICFLYIFRSFVLIFCTWLVIFFIILLAIKQIDGYYGYSFMQNLSFSLIRSFDVLLDNINIVALISCVSFFIKTDRIFNINVLKSFGIPSRKILKPMILFLFLFSLINTFVLRPINIKLNNYQKIKLNRLKSEDKIFLKNGTNFMIANEKSSSEYTIIIGVYNEINNDRLKFSNASFFVYKDDTLIKSYLAKSAILHNKSFILKDVNIVDILDKNNAQNKFAKYIKLSSSLSVSDMRNKIYSKSKMQKAMKLGFYDYLKLFRHNSYSNIVKNETDLQARAYFLKEIVAFFTVILCCLLSFLFYMFKTRSSSMIKPFSVCFVVYFIILRFFKFLENFTKSSDYLFFFIICFAYLLCVFTYMAILDKDWCHYFKMNFYKQVNVIKNKVWQKIKYFQEKKLVFLTR